MWLVLKTDALLSSKSISNHKALADIFSSVFRGHLTSVNISVRKEEGYYTYSFKSGRDLMPDL
jgi:hypothetical protein